MNKLSAKQMSLARDAMRHLLKSQPGKVAEDRANPERRGSAIQSLRDAGLPEDDTHVHAWLLGASTMACAAMAQLFAQNKPE